MSSLPSFTPAEREYFAAMSLVSQACLKATEMRYLEPYYEMKAAAVSLAREVIRLRGELTKNGVAE